MGMDSVTWIISGSWRDLNISYQIPKQGPRKHRLRGCITATSRGQHRLDNSYVFALPHVGKTCGIKELLRTPVTPGTCRWARVKKPPCSKRLAFVDTFTVDLTYGDFPSYLCLPFISYVFLVRRRIIFYGNLKFKKQEYFTNLSLPKINSTACGV